LDTFRLTLLNGALFVPPCVILQLGKQVSKLIWREYRQEPITR